MNVEQATEVDKITITKVDIDKLNSLDSKMCSLCKIPFYQNQDLAILSCKVSSHLSCLEKMLTEVTLIVPNLL